MSAVGESNSQIETPAGPAADEGESLRDTLVAAMRAGKEREVAPGAETPAAPAAPAAAVKVGADGRDASGRFAGKITAESLKTSPAATAPADGAQQQTAPSAADAPKAPDSWSAPMKEKFPTLAPDVQAYISQREAESNKKITANDDDRNFGKRIKDTLSPYMQTIVQEGGTPEKAVDSLFRTALILRSPNPAMRASALQAIAKQFNIPLGQPLQRGPQYPELAPIQQRLDRIEQGQQAELQQRQSQETAQITGFVEAFAADPKNVHYEAVKPKMAALLSSGQAKDLQDAYDQAIWADPAIRSTLTAAEVQAAAGKRSTDAQSKADIAKRANVSVVGGPGGAIPAQGASADSGSLRDQIRANFRAATDGRI